MRVQPPAKWTIEPVFATAATILEKLRDEAVKVAHVTVPEDQEMQYWYRQGVVDGVMQLLQVRAKWGRAFGAGAAAVCVCCCSC